MYSIAFGQNKEEAEKLVNEGIAYHDKGDYKGAIVRYDKALELDEDNLLALAEKAMTLVSLQKYAEAIKYCEKVIEKHPGNKALNMVYVTYGNASDGLNKTDRSLEIYDEGIKLFPNFYQLYFNKGITLSSVKKYDEALTCFQKAASLNPKHGSSHNALARLLFGTDKNIPSLLACCRLLILEPESNRGKEDLIIVQKIMGGDVEKTGKNSITININNASLGDTTADGKNNENNFSMTSLILAMTAGLDYDKANKKKTKVEQFIRKFEVVCSTLKESQNKNYGFYWSYYAPYFIEMKDKGLVTTFAYIAFASSADSDVSSWLKSHKTEIQEFYKWSNGYSW